jgi:formyltetrahydrofolate deformylase
MRKVVIHIKSLDQKGIISTFTDVLSSLNINIVNLEQHVEPDDQLFFMRVEAEILDKKLSYQTLEKVLSKTDKKISGISKVFTKEKKQNLAILVTKESLPLYDILIKNQTEEINSNIKIIISNHKTLEPIANQFDIDFMYLDVENKTKSSKVLMRALDKNNINLVILARYMQIIPETIVKKFKGKMINIHHGFLPAFKGDRPYHKAWKRGVKIIGATAHYVTAQLDEGPIISQDVVQVDHHHSIKELIDSGRNLERNVLVNAIKAHLDHRVMIHGKRTIVFSR